LELLDLVKEINNIMASNDESLIIYFNENSSIIYQDKEFSNLFLSLLVIYQKDLINYKINDMENIIFTEELETISILSTSKTKNRLIDDLENTLSLKSRLNNYINERLAFDNLMLNLERR